MHAEHAFEQAAIYLLAAVIAVPLAKRLGLGSVLGYLLAGICIGPFALGWVGEAGTDVMHFAEFGVVMMLFVVGLELQPSLLWKLRLPILGLGGLQVLCTTLVVSGVAMAFGTTGKESLVIGMILAMSSTAIVLQTLAEKGWLKSTAGQSAFSVLLFQDMAVIPMLAAVPLLAASRSAVPVDDHGTLTASLPPALKAVVVIGAVLSIVVAGRYGLGPIFRAVARTRLRELFTALTLLLVIVIALLMTKVGLSPALGTFVAGVVLAGSEFRHELESDIAPFKGLLLGLFFISVGASIDFQVIARSPGLVFGLAVVIMVGKTAILAVLGKAFRLGRDQNLIFSLSLPQVGEFAFVLVAFAATQGALSLDKAAPLNAAIAITMALTPIGMVLLEKVLLPRVMRSTPSLRPADTIEDRGRVIVAGFGRFGQIVTRLLRSAHIEVVVLESDADQVDFLRKFGYRVFYGDASRVDLLHAAGAEEASVIVLAIDNAEKRLEMVHTCQKHFPHAVLVARATSRTDAYALMDAGVAHVIRETFGSSVAMGEQVLRILGMRAHTAHQQAQKFWRHDEASLAGMAEIRRKQEGDWMSAIRRKLSDLEQTLQMDKGGFDKAQHGTWDEEPLRKLATKGKPDGT